LASAGVQDCADAAILTNPKTAKAEAKIV